MKNANFSLAEAKFSAGDFSSDIVQNVGNARLKLKARTDNVAGVSLPIFEVILQNNPPNNWPILAFIRWHR